MCIVYTQYTSYNMYVHLVAEAVIPFFDSGVASVPPRLLDSTSVSEADAKAAVRATSFIRDKIN